MKHIGDVNVEQRSHQDGGSPHLVPRHEGDSYPELGGGTRSRGLPQVSHGEIATSPMLGMPADVRGGELPVQPRFLGDVMVEGAASQPKRVGAPQDVMVR